MLLYPFLSTGAGLFKDPIVTGRLYMRIYKSGHHQAIGIVYRARNVGSSFHFKNQNACPGFRFQASAAHYCIGQEMVGFSFQKCRKSLDLLN
jgi:hypothetical protein